MTHKHFSLIVAALMATLATLAACHRNGAAPTAAATDSASPAPVEAENIDTVQQTLAQVAPAPAPAPKAAKPQAKPAARPAAAKSKAETIYVETEGAQGRVWGHVTMQGETGRGTIHDWDENTLSVRVRRHGDELYAIDQNSRQYVFKLRQ